MADPVTIGLGLAVAGGAVKGIGSILGGEAQSDMYKYQASVAQVNKKIAEQNADYAIKSGEAGAQREGMKGSFEFGALKTGRAASGFDVNTGSNAKVLESKEAINTYNQSVIRSNAAKQAYGYKVDAMTAGSQAQLYKMAASNAETSGIIEGIGSFLGTAGSVGSKWSQYSLGAPSTPGTSSLGESQWDG